MTIEPGQTLLNKYRILRHLGEGGMGRVWLAEETGFDHRQVAIKEVHFERFKPDERAECEERFQREIDLSARLATVKAPYVVTAITAETLPDGTRLLVMEYAAGGSVADEIAAHPGGLPSDQAVTIVQQVCQALAIFHDLPAAPVHRDIKPSNILLTTTGEARLSDFGLSQVAGASSGRTNIASKSHPGTLLYMAPEQEQQSGYLAPTADIYALGCVLFELLTGKRYKTQRPNTRPSALNPAVPKALDAVVLKAVSATAWDRYATADEFGAALAHATPARTPVTRRFLWAAVGVLAVVILAFALWNTVGRAGTPPPPVTPDVPAKTDAISASAAKVAVATATATPVPTATATPVPTATATPVPTATATPIPTATDTPIPTATDTPVPTATDTPVPTATDTPVPTATDTPVPTATDTPVPTATDTPVLTATDTPVPTATDTMVPTASPTDNAPATATQTPLPTATWIAPQIDMTELSAVQLVGPVLLEGIGEPGASVRIGVNGEAVGQAMVDASGRWRQVISIPAPGRYVVLAELLSRDGSLLAVSEGVALTVVLPTATASDTPTVTETPTATATSTPRPTATASPTPCASGSVKVKGACATVTPIATATHTPKPTATAPPTTCPDGWERVDGICAMPTQLPTATRTPRPVPTWLPPTIDTSQLSVVQLVGPMLLQGTGQPGATVRINLNGDLVGQATVDAQGRWGQVVTLPAPGRYVVLVESLDQKGQLLAVSDGITLEAALPTATPTQEPSPTHKPQPTATQTPCARGAVRVQGSCATITPSPTPTRTPRPTATRTPRPTATRTPRATATATWTPRVEPPQRDIQALIDRWDQIHHEADYSLDPADLHLVLTGTALRQQEETLRDLSRTGCYWDFSDLEPSQLTEWDVVSSDEVEVTMRKHWDGKLYCKGQLDRKRSFTEPFSVRYRIIWTSQGWRIAEKLALD